MTCTFYAVAPCLGDQPLPYTFGSQAAQAVVSSERLALNRWPFAAPIANVHSSLP